MTPGRLTALLLLVMMSMVPAAAAEVTVETFVQRLAQAMNVDATDGRVAVQALGDAGVALPADLDLSARLTEGEVARVSRALGLAVSTHRPNATFTSEQIDGFFAASNVERALATAGIAAASGVGENPIGTPPARVDIKRRSAGKGKKRGRAADPEEPE